MSDLITKLDEEIKELKDELRISENQRAIAINSEWKEGDICWFVCWMFHEGYRICNETIRDVMDIVHASQGGHYKTKEEAEELLIEMQALSHFNYKSPQQLISEYKIKLVSERQDKLAQEGVTNVNV